MDAMDLTGAMNDEETRIAISNEIVKFNREVVEHNKQCPKFQVLGLRPYR